MVGMTVKATGTTTKAERKAVSEKMEALRKEFRDGANERSALAVEAVFGLLGKRMELPEVGAKVALALSGLMENVTGQEPLVQDIASSLSYLLDPANHKAHEERYAKAVDTLLDAAAEGKMSLAKNVVEIAKTVKHNTARAAGKTAVGRLENKTAPEPAFGALFLHGR